MPLERLRQYLAAVMTGKRPRSAASQRRHGLMVDFMAGGAYMLLTRWISQGRPLTAEEMGRLLYQLTRLCEDPQP